MSRLPFESGHVAPAPRSSHAAHLLPGPLCQPQTAHGPLPEGSSRLHVLVLGGRRYVPSPAMMDGEHHALAGLPAARCTLCQADRGPRAAEGQKRSGRLAPTLLGGSAWVRHGPQEPRSGTIRSAYGKVARQHGRRYVGRVTTRRVVPYVSCGLRVVGARLTLAPRPDRHCSLHIGSFSWISVTVFDRFGSVFVRPRSRRRAYTAE
eukprot:5161659-Prymnesium_polylepis.1